ncbi:hypothetical protein LOCC1_G007421 [Lachnellula occidentalis]|uniref:Cytochrome b561 domain-containing protein n=1 Tax=Lachnellula occidentalis TaxID=215460 RepID=A0A8H8RM55_9HELO|nr:hypothetical protein LOCC1_G007421 [Lachnellula occidentalis]
MFLFKAFGLLALASSTLAQQQSYCTVDNVCYAVNVPEASASSGSGDLFFQISGPANMSWIGLGQGTQMMGANIFMIYANSAGTNVTLSPRSGIGEKPPATDSAASVSLLDGSGISNGTMSANVKCSNCNSWSAGSMSFTDASSKWIWAYKSGDPISSDSATAAVTFHSKFGTTEFDLTQAAGGNSANPFTAASAATTTSSSAKGSGSGGPPEYFTAVLIAHATLLPIAFVLMMPMGAMAIRLLSFKGLIWVHAGWMIFAYAISIAGMGMGIWIALEVNKLDTYHAIIGLFVITCLTLQPVTGLVHHLLYKKTGGKNVATYPHVWWGRAIVTLGIINGGFGLQLARKYAPLANGSRKGEIAYGVIAGPMWILWMSVVVFSSFKSQEKQQGEAIMVRTNSGEKIMNAGSEKE